MYFLLYFLFASLLNKNNVLLILFLIPYTLVVLGSRDGLDRYPPKSMINKIVDRENWQRVGTNMNNISFW